MSANFPETRNSLLLRLRDQENDDAWSEFSALYRPIIYRIARQKGLQEADAQDLAQRVLLSIASSIKRWEFDPQEAKFSTWLHRVIRNAIIDQRRRRDPAAPAGGSALLHQLAEIPDQHGLEDQIERESRRETFRIAARQIRGEFECATWNAFWMTAVEGISTTQAASELGTTVGAVYTARSRVMSRLKQKVRDYE